MLPLTRSRNRARFFGTPFSPEALFAGGTVAGAWYDPSDPSTLFTTSAGTTQCAMPGGGVAVSVGRMLDKSGNGNHAIAFNDTTARPELRARVNLLEYSEQFDNAYWSTANTTVSANTTTAPDGTTTADSLLETAASNSHGLFSTITLAGASHVFSVCVKDNGRRYATIAITSGASDANSIAAIFDLQTGASTANIQQGTGVFVSASVAPLGNGWYRCTIEGSNSTSSQTCYPVIATSDRSGFTGTLVNNLFASYAGDITKGIYIWGADLRPANIGANVPAYQRIADANTYDTSGFPLYLRFDGIDDSMTHTFGINANVTLMCAARRAGGTGGQGLLGVTPPSTRLVGLITANAVNPNWGTYAGGAFQSSGQSLLETSLVTTNVAEPATPSQKLYTNQALSATITGALYAGDGNERRIIGNDFTTAALWYLGNLYGAIAVAKVLTDAERTASVTWLGNKMGQSI